MNPDAILVADPDQCNGCRLCEIACSIQHTGLSRPALSCIQVHNTEEGFFLPVFCQQCADAPCAAVCPKEAISRDAATGAVTIDGDRCVACRMCVYACPYGAMGFDAERRRVFKCDLCGGDPRCVAFCEAGALCFDDAVEIKIRRMNQAAQRLMRGAVPAA